MKFSGTFVFNVILTFVGYLMPIFVEEQQWYNLTHSWRDKGFHAFHKVICPKLNLIAQLKFELAYYDVTVQHIWDFLFGTLRYKQITQF